jgi:hypothetical protein
VANDGLVENMGIHRAPEMQFEREPMRIDEHVVPGVELPVAAGVPMPEPRPALVGASLVDEAPEALCW